MRILILGGDGYIGWPTAMKLAAAGHQVMAVDNYLRRRLMREIDCDALFDVPNLHERARLWADRSGKELAVRIGDLEVHNIYLPAGGDVPDPDSNDKFAHKLDFLARMAEHYAQEKTDPLVILGDLNVAPHENDVWSHKQMLKVVSHTPVETDALNTVLKAGAFTDLGRQGVADDQKLYTWWSYRSRDWAASNRGRRLDHIWANPSALPLVTPDSHKVHLPWRGGWKPSDHAPISVDLSLA